MGVLALTGGLEIGQMEGRGGVAGWGIGGHLREERPPQLLGAGSKHEVRHPTFQSSGSRARRWGVDGGGVGHPQEPLPGPPEGGEGGRKLQKARLGGVPALGPSGRGCPRIHAAGAPLGPLCSEGGKATEGFCQHGAGAGSRELLPWLRSVAWRGPMGLLRSG